MSEALTLSFDQIVAATAAPLERSLGRWTGRPDVAADLAQETYLRAYRNLGRLRSPASARGWIFAIGRQVAADWLRRERPRAALPLREVASPAPGCGAPGTDVRLALLEAVEALEPELRAVVELKYDARLSYAEIGRIERVPPTTVQARLRRAKRDLADRLGPRLEDLVPAAASPSFAAPGRDEAGAAAEEAFERAIEAAAAARPSGTADLPSRVAEALRREAPARPPAGRAPPPRRATTRVLAAGTLAACLLAGAALLSTATAPPAEPATPSRRARGTEAIAMRVAAEPRASAAPAPARAARAPEEAAAAAPPEPTVATSSETAPRPDIPTEPLPLDARLGLTSLTMSFPDTTLADAVNFLRDITSANYVMDASVTEEEAAATVRFKVRNVSLPTALDLLEMFTSCRWSIDSKDTVRILGRGSAERPAGRPSSLVLEAVLRLRSSLARQRLLHAFTALPLRVDTPEQTVEEALEALAAQSEVAIVALPAVERSCRVPGPIDAHDLDHALRQVLDACGRGYGYRVHREVVLVDLGYGPGFHEAPSRLREARLDLRLSEPSPRALAAALAGAGVPVALQEEIAARGPLPISIEGAATFGALADLLESAETGAALVEVDGTAALVEARRRPGFEERFDAAYLEPVAHLGEAVRRWFEAERAGGAGLDADFLAAMTASGRTAADRIAAAKALAEERRALSGSLIQARAALRELDGIRGWLALDGDDPDPETHRRWATAVRFRAEIERLEAGAAPPEIFRDGFDAFRKALSEANAAER